MNASIILSAAIVTVLINIVTVSILTKQSKNIAKLADDMLKLEQLAAELKADITKVANDAKRERYMAVTVKRGKLTRKEKKVATFSMLKDNPNTAISELIAKLGISRATAYNYMNEWKQINSGMNNQ